MRLSDHIKAEAGGATDREVGGIFTSVSKAIAQAQRFELTDDVATAAYMLTKSKPSSLFAALPMVRAPYRTMWVEWRGGLVDTLVERDLDSAEGEKFRAHKRDKEFAPSPIKQGALIESDESGQVGTITFGWIHRDKPEMDYTPTNICPLGMRFNWREDGNVFDDAERAFNARYPEAATDTLEELMRRPTDKTYLLERILHTRYSIRPTDEQVRERMQASIFKKWNTLAGNPAERAALLKLAVHATPCISPHASGFIKWTARALRSGSGLMEFLNTLKVSWESDIEGEGPMVEAIIAMMNSRNAIEHRDVDLRALNKSRAKRGRAEFLPYRTTHLRLSQAQQRAFRAGAISREQAGRHWVLGHFKIRRTGVFWWTPFLRGDPAREIKRQAYLVE